MNYFNMSRLEAYKDMLDREELVNLTLVTEDGGELKVHKEILVGKSPYFKRLIMGTDELTDEKITLSGISTVILTDVINYIYTGKLRINEEKIKDLADVAERFSMSNMMKLCEQFMVCPIDAQNCINRLEFGTSYQYNDLKDKAMSFILCNFEKVYKSNQDFHNLKAEDLVAILNSDMLNVSHEECVYEALVKWVNTDPSSRSFYMANLLRCLRFGLCDSTFLQKSVARNPMIMGDEDCQGILRRASEFAEQRSEGAPMAYDVNDPFLRPRVPNEIIFVMGGWNGNSATNIMETYDFKTQRWFLTLNSDTISRAYHGMLWHFGKIYLIGGFDGNQYFNSVRTYDPVTHIWEQVGCMNVQRCYVSVASVGKMIYAMGGYDGIRRNRSSEKYDMDQNQWTLIANMHHARSDASADSLEGKIYIAGGFNGSHILDSAERYDPETDTWTLINSMNFLRSGVRVTAFQNHIYAIGGFNGNSRLATVERYDRHTNRWTDVPPMLGQRSNFAAAVVGGCLYAIGGFNGLRTTSTVEKYDPDTNEWKVVPDLNLTRSALAACKVSDITTAQEYSFLGIYR